METGQFQLTFRSEAELGYTITSVQVQPQIVYVYLAKNYTAEGDKSW